MTDDEFKTCIDDIRTKILHLRDNGMAPPAHIWIVEMPDFLDASMPSLPRGGKYESGPIFPYSSIWGVSYSECRATADRPRGIWIEDRDKMLHRVR